VRPFKSSTVIFGMTTLLWLKSGFESRYLESHPPSTASTWPLT
jgi:hypothetical protein